MAAKGRVNPTLPDTAVVEFVSAHGIKAIRMFYGDLMTPGKI